MCIGTSYSLSVKMGFYEYEVKKTGTVFNLPSTSDKMNEDCREANNSFASFTVLAFQTDALSWATVLSAILFYTSPRVLYSRIFSSAKNFVKSDRQAVHQEFIFVKRRLSLVCSSVVRLSLFCLSFIFTLMTLSDPTTCSFVKIVDFE